MTSPIRMRQTVTDIYRSILAARNGNDRTQALISFAPDDSQCGNYVLEAYTNVNGVKKGKTQKVHNIIHLLTHPNAGHRDYKSTSTNYNNIPFNVPKALWKSRGGTLVLQHVITQWQKKEFTDKELERVYNQYKDDSLFDLGESRVWVQLKMIRANFGDLVFFKTFHGNASSAAPRLALIIDYVPDYYLDRVLPRYTKRLTTKQLTDGVRTILEKKSVSFGTGTGRSPYLEEEYLKLIQKETVTVPDTTRIICDTNVITDEDVQTLDEFGSVVISMRDRLGTAEHTEWLKLCKEAMDEFSGFFNYSVFGRVGLSKAFDFKNWDDDLWKVLSGRSYAEKILGSRYKYIANRSQTDWKTGETKFSKTAQGGQALVTLLYGMGLATNACRLPAQLKLNSSDIIINAFKRMYSTDTVYNCYDRWRLKPGHYKGCLGSKPLYNVMPLHDDRTCSILFK